mmetsp:Transcript_45517/g.93110  ORF Transcript_45517/g.93110 Transcript_45517/m.93110 type:complete len:214 (-) Transcript_45517:2108-2749(-)
MVSGPQHPPGSLHGKLDALAGRASWWSARARRQGPARGVAVGCRSRQGPGRAGVVRPQLEDSPATAPRALTCSTAREPGHLVGMLRRRRRQLPPWGGATSLVEAGGCIMMAGAGRPTIISDCSLSGGPGPGQGPEARSPANGGGGAAPSRDSSLCIDPRACAVASRAGGGDIRAHHRQTLWSRPIRFSWRLAGSAKTARMGRKNTSPLRASTK